MGVQSPSTLPTEAIGISRKGVQRVAVMVLNFQATILSSAFCCPEEFWAGEKELLHPMHQKWKVKTMNALCDFFLMDLF